MVTDVVKVDTESSVRTLRDDTRKRAYESLGFFLTSVLRTGVNDSVAYSLQGLGMKKLAALAAGLTCWLILHKVKVLDASAHDVVRWLFPEVKKVA